jgi:hypothetical protein
MGCRDVTSSPLIERAAVVGMKKGEGNEIDRKKERYQYGGVDAVLD